MVSPTDIQQANKGAKLKDRTMDELAMNVSTLSTEEHLQDVAGFVEHEEIVNYIPDDDDFLQDIEDLRAHESNNFLEMMETAEIEMENRRNEESINRKVSQTTSDYKGCIPKKVTGNNGCGKSSALVKDTISSISSVNQVYDQSAHVSNQEPRPQGRSASSSTMNMKRIDGGSQDAGSNNTLYRPLNIQRHNQNAQYNRRGRNHQMEMPQPNETGSDSRVQRYATGPRVYSMPPGLNDLTFSIRPSDYPNSVIDGNAFTIIQNTLKKLMALTGTSERGLSLVGKHGFILTRCSRLEQAQYIRDVVERIDWEGRGTPELVNVSANDDNVLPHIEARTMDTLATFNEIVAAVEMEQFGNERIRCTSWRTLNQMKPPAGGLVILILVDRGSALTLMRNKYANLIRLGAFSPPVRLIVPKAVRIMLGEREGEVKH